MKRRSGSSRQRESQGQDQFGVSILAGGLSTRMGRDKAALRLGGRPLLGIVRRAAQQTGWRVRVIRRDCIRRCGPLGGIHAALLTGRAEAELFLACDMPFVSPAWLRTVTRALRSGRMAVFSGRGRHGRAGFPLVVRRAALPVVLDQIGAGNYSLQALALALKARVVTIPVRRGDELFNINTREDWAAALERVRRSKRGGQKASGRANRPR